ncbi:MAG: hypothetical protein ACREGC_00925 [Minisyncoccia bacterium]
MKIKIFKKTKDFKKKDFALNALLYWKFFVAVAGIVLFAAFFFGYRLFTGIIEESPDPLSTTDNSVPKVDEARINSALQYFKDREQRSADILNSPAPVVDPSL